MTRIQMLVAVFVAHPTWFLYLWHGHVAIMNAGVC